MVDRQDYNNRKDTNNHSIVDQTFLKAKIMNCIMSCTSANIIIGEFEHNNNPFEETLKSQQQYMKISWLASLTAETI